MLFRYFKRPLPTTLFLIVFIAIVSWAKPIFELTPSGVGFHDYSMPFFLLVSKLFTSNIWISIGVSFVLTILIGLYLIQLNIKFILIKNRTYLPFLFFVLICSSIPELQGHNPAIYASLFLVLAINRLFSSYENPNQIDLIFRAGLNASIATLFYLPSAIFLLIIFIALIVFNFQGVRVWLVSVIGFATPLLFVFFYYYFFDNNLMELIDTLTGRIGNINPPSIQYSIKHFIYFGYTLLLVLISSVYLVWVTLVSQKIVVRRYFAVFLWFIFPFSVGAITFSYSSIEIILIVAVPFSFIMANFFANVRNRFWSELLFTLLLISTFLMQIIK